MKPSKMKIRNKIKTNGFTKKELFSFRQDYNGVKRTFHPKLTKDFALQDVIYKQAKESFSPLKLFLSVALFFLILSFFFNAHSNLFMAASFALFAFWEVFATAKSYKLTFINQLKLIKLAIRIMF